MGGPGSFLKALRSLWKAPDQAAQVLEAARKEVVLCVGCHEDAPIIDSVLPPGAYDITFRRTIEGAYSHIARVMPDRVILCMRADDEGSLQVLSMLSLDPRTSRIPVITCVPPVAASLEGLDREGANGLAAATPGLVMH